MKHIKALFVAIAVLLATHMLYAQEAGWNFTLGGGVAGENVYVGSDDYYLMPLPNFKASYAKGSFDYSFSLLDGLGVTYTNQKLGLLTSVTVNAGESRNSQEYSLLGMQVKHSAPTLELLKGTSNLDVPLALDVTLAYLTPVGLFGASLAYNPVTVEYNQTSLKDETRHGFVYSLQYMAGLPLSDRLSMSGLVSVDFMDGNFADTWFTVNQVTNSLNTFKARAGLRSSMIAVEMNYEISKRFRLSLLGASTILLQDARKSPFTVETVQRTMMLQTLYHF